LQFDHNLATFWFYYFTIWISLCIAIFRKKIICAWAITHCQTLHLRPTQQILFDIYISKLCKLLHLIPTFVTFCVNSSQFNDWLLCKNNNTSTYVQLTHNVNHYIFEQQSKRHSIFSCTHIVYCCNLSTTFGFTISQFESVFVLPDINSSTHEHVSKENCLCMHNHTLWINTSSSNTINLILYLHFRNTANCCIWFQQYNLLH